MDFRGAIAAALMGSTIMAVPVSATMVAHARASTFTVANDNPLSLASTSTDVSIVVIADAYRPDIASFTTVTDASRDVAAPLPSDMNSADGIAAVVGTAGTLDFTTQRKTLMARRRVAGAFDANVSDASILPEATTWAMMLIGFAMIGFGMRYGIRRSNMKFDLKVQRIAAGLED